MTTGSAATDSADRDARLCLSAMYTGVNLLVGVLHAHLNPKIRYSQ